VPTRTGGQSHLLWSKSWGSASPLVTRWPAGGVD
jgi:hypothetical protein